MSRPVSVLLTTLVAVSALLVGGPAVAADPESDATPSSATLTAGEELNAGERLSSANGQFHLVVQTDGNAVLYATRTHRARWTTNTLGTAPERLAMQPDGNLVLYGPDDDTLWASNTAGHPEARLTLLDDGSLVLSWPDGKRVLAKPDSELAAGDTLEPGQSLVSPKGKFRLVLQPDGNLVQTKSGKGPVWATGTRGDNRLTLDTEGNLAVRRASAPDEDPSTGKTKWSTKTDVAGARLVIQDDGNLVLYAGTIAVWSRGDEERQRAAAADLAAASVTVAPGDDYPHKNARPCGSGIYCELGSQYSARGFAYRNCTDFVAWKIGLQWHQIADGRNGHAVGWRQGWIERGRSVGATPKVGSVAWWSRGAYGHVAYVVAVNPDGSAVVEQYNAGGGGEYSTQVVRAEAYLY